MTEKFKLNRTWIRMAARSIDEGCQGWDLRLMCSEEERDILDKARCIAQRVMEETRGKENYFDIEVPCEEDD